MLIEDMHIAEERGSLEQIILDKLEDELAI